VFVLYSVFAVMYVSPWFSSSDFSFILVNSVAISGIVDLDVHKDFPQHAGLLSECRAAIKLQYPKIRDHLQTYRQFVDDYNGLKEARLGELMKELKKDMSRFEDNSDEMVTIEILRIL
jgi:hypothetical protein